MKIKPLTYLLFALLVTVVAWFAFSRGSNREKPTPSHELGRLPDTPEALLSRLQKAPASVEQREPSSALLPAVTEPVGEVSLDSPDSAPRSNQVHPREAAPDLDPSRLSPRLRRTYASYESLRTEAISNPDSPENRETVAALEAIREQRNAQ